MVSNPFQDGLTVEIGADAGGLTSEIDNALGSIGGLETAVAGLGAALAALGTKALSDATSASMNFEQAMADVEKVTDPETAEAMGDEIQGMAERIPLAHDELAELATQAGRMGAEGSEEIASFTETAGSMASATVLSADEAGTALGKMSSALNEDLGDVDRLADAINEVSNNFQTDSAEIVDAAQRSGSVLSELGMRSEDILGLSGAFNEAYPSSELAAQAMQQVGEAMMDPAHVDMFSEALGVTSDEFEEMRNENPQETMLDLMGVVDDGSLSFEEMSDVMTTQQARAFRDTADNADNMREAMDTANQAADEGGSVAAELATETDTLSGQIALFRNRVHNLWIQIGDNLTPYLRDLLEVINVAFGYFEGIQNATDGWAGTITALVAVVGGLAMTIGSLASQLGLASGILSGTATAFVGITGPIAVAAGLIYAFQNDLAGFRTHTMRVVEALQEALQPAIDWLGSDGASMFDTIKDAVFDFFELAEPYVERFIELLADGLIIAIETTASVIGTAFNVISDVITTAWESVIRPFLEWSAEMWDEHLAEPVGEVQQALADAWALIQDDIQTLQDDYIQPFMEWFDETTEKVLGRISEWWDDHGETVMAVVDFLFSNLKTIIEGAVATIGDIISLFVDAAYHDWDSFREGVLSIVDRLVGGVIDFFQWLYDMLIGNSIIPDMLNAIIDFTTSWAESYLNLITDTLQAVYEFFSEQLDNVLTFVTETFSNIHDFVSDQFSTTLEFITDTLGVIYDTFVTQFQLVFDFVSDIWTSLNDDTVSTWDVILQFINDTLDNIFGAVESILTNVLDYFTQTFDNIRTLVSDQFSAIHQFITDTLNNILSTAQDSLSNLLSLLTDTLSEMLSLVTTWGSDARTAFFDALNEIYSVLGNAGRQIIERMGNIVSDALSRITNAFSEFRSAGEGLVGAIVDGIKSAPGAVKDAVGDVVGDARDMLPFSDAKEGPFSDLTDSGEAIPETIATGAESNLGQLTDVLGKLDRPVPAGAAAGGAAGDNIEINVDARGADSPRQVENAAEKGLSNALDAYNIGR
jgi:TP901 family phage tail tape measure protein